MKRKKARVAGMWQVQVRILGNGVERVHGSHQIGTTVECLDFKYTEKSLRVLN